MTKTASTMMPLGTVLPSFDLPVVNRIENKREKHLAHKALRQVSSDLFKKKPLLIMVICAHCPFVKHIENEITNIQNDYLRSIDVVAISSNSLITHPKDGPEYLAKQANKNGWEFPYLFDEKQSLAKDLKAACTPDFFLFAPLKEGIQKLYYRGQFDNSRPGNNIPVSGTDVRQALDSILEAKSISFEQKPSIGCNIKWHPGQEPHWFG